MADEKEVEPVYDPAQDMNVEVANTTPDVVVPTANVEPIVEPDVMEEVMVDVPEDMELPSEDDVNGDGIVDGSPESIGKLFSDLIDFFTPEKRSEGTQSEVDPDDVNGDGIIDGSPQSVGKLIKDGVDVVFGDPEDAKVKKKD